MVRSALLITLVGALLGGCTRRYVRPESIAPDVTDLQVRDRTGGTCFRCIRVGDVVWATDGRALLLLDDRGRVVRSVELGESGADAPIVELLVVGDRAVAVFEEDHVQVLDFADPRFPVTVRRADARRLGLTPRGAAVIEDEIIVLSDEGAVSLDSLERLVRSAAVQSMVDSPSGGWYVTGRRIHRLDDGKYIGTASQLARGPSGQWAFVRNEGDAALLGMLGADGHEIDPRHLTRGVPSPVHQLRFDGSRLAAVAADGLYLFELREHQLQPLVTWKQVGLHDALMFEDGTVLAVGEHGRSLLDPRRRGALEVYRHESPGGLVNVGPSTGGLVATGAAGGWSFQPGRDVTRVHGAIAAAIPPTSASMLDWSVELDEAGVAAITTPLGQVDLEPPDGGRFTCVTTTPAAFWLGHDRGILRLAPPAIRPEVPELEEGETVDPMLGSTQMSVRLGGPVLGCTPLVLGRGVAYATAHDGFGMVVERKSHPDAPQH
ncbi:MAG: hypothetical protein MK101_03795 [Phycisphaerales bacterium]|nr:hypothetical protein [Phycisphaerales bacterium]